MAKVAISSCHEPNARRYVQAVSDYAQTLVITPKSSTSPSDVLRNGVSGLLLTGGPDINPLIYGEVPDSGVGLELSDSLDTLELGLLRDALERDMPVLAICRGMQLLNVAFGGGLLANIPGHKGEEKDGRCTSAHHSIYLSPGCKLAAILGMGGFFKVNSLHQQGLREAQKSPRLMATAYSLEDGIIEGLESPEHSWVVGVQCRPELQDEVPKVFSNLFQAFAQRAERYSSGS